MFNGLFLNIITSFFNACCVAMQPSLKKFCKTSTAVTKPDTDCVISGFRREVAENWFLLGYYAASSGNFLPKKLPLLAA